MSLTVPETKRPWYRIRWQLVVFAVISVAGSFYFRHLSERSLEVAVTTGRIGQNKTLKERMIFLVTLEKAFHRKGWLASLDLAGEDGKTLTVYWEQLDRPMARQIVRSTEIIPELRDMGFKRLVLRGKRQEWDVDLKN